MRNFSLLFVLAYVMTGCSNTGVSQSGVSSSVSSPKSLNYSIIDHIGDSRTSGIYVGGFKINGLTSQHWFNQANALAGNRYLLGLNLGRSGDRTDQYFAVNLSQALASNSGWLLIGFPAINDLAQSGASYVNTYGSDNGTTVTTTNVSTVAANNIIYAANQALALGKRVILTEEPGSTGLSPAGVAALFDLNARLRAFAAATPGVYIWSANSAVWSPVGSATAIVFRTGYTIDGTHYSTTGGYSAAVAFNNFAQYLFPAWDQQIGNISNPATDPRELVANPLFTILTGGASTGCGTVTGNVPSGWQLSCGSVSTNITITSAANAGGFGNDITLAITTSGIDTINFTPNAPNNSLWSLTDYFVGSANISVAAGSSRAAVFINVQSATDAGGVDNWGLYSISYSDGPTTAYNYQLRTLPGQVQPNSTTQSYVALYNYVYFSAAGSASVTFSRVSLLRSYHYGSGVFSGR